MTNHDPSDAEIVERILEGETACFRLLVERYERLMYSYLLPQMHSLAEVEDLAQEAFIKAYRYLPSFDKTRKFSAWLLTIARNLLVDHFQRNASRVRHLSYLDQIGPRQDPERSDTIEPGRQLQTREAFRQTFQEMLELSEEQRVPLLMRVLLDMPYQEIAETLDLPLQTVKNRIFQARKVLRERRKDDHGL